VTRERDFQLEQSDLKLSLGKISQIGVFPAPEKPNLESDPRVAMYSLSLRLSWVRPARENGTNISPW
jgi:hypothetical protein